MFLLCTSTEPGTTVDAKEGFFLNTVVFCFVLLYHVVFFLLVDIKTNTFLIVVALVHF